MIEQIDDIPLYGLPVPEQGLRLRMAAAMLGQPALVPVRDIPFHRNSMGLDGKRWWYGEGEFPPGLETLAEDFIEHGYDLQRLIRLIAATEMFQLDSRADSPITRYHESLRAVFPHTRLRPEQIARTITQSCSVTTIDANSHIVDQLQQFFQQNEFIKRYGDTGEDEFGAHGGTLTQRLMLMNGKLAHEVPEFKPMLTNASSQVLRFAPSREKAIETVYLTTLSRPPSPREAEYFARVFAEAPHGDRGQIETIEDIYWTMINKDEFTWNH